MAGDDADEFAVVDDGEAGEFGREEEAHGAGSGFVDADAEGFGALLGDGIASGDVGPFFARDFFQEIQPQQPAEIAIGGADGVGDVVAARLSGRVSGMTAGFAVMRSRTRTPARVSRWTALA